MLRIDAHIHYSGNHSQSVALIEEHNLVLNNIAIVQQPGDMTLSQRYRQLTNDHPNRFGWCTTFDPFGFDQPGFADRVIAQLATDIANGAVGCKVWKNVGMEITDAAGQLILCDHPAFDPVYRYLQAEGIPLLMHIGEPLACWQPLDPRSPHYGYYSTHPQWHMHNRTDMHHHAVLIQARDNVAARYPDLRVIGAHFGSLEYDVEEVAKRLNRYPNFAVDTSARAADLTLQDVGRVREFFCQYADRILWGTDLVHFEDHASITDEARQALLDLYRQTLHAEWELYESDGPMHYLTFPGHGLNLPADVLQKIYHDNALHWYPALATRLASSGKP